MLLRPVIAVLLEHSFAKLASLISFSGPGCCSGQTHVVPPKALHCLEKSQSLCHHDGKVLKKTQVALRSEEDQLLHQKLSKGCWQSFER